MVVKIQKKTEVNIKSYITIDTRKERWGWVGEVSSQTLETVGI